MGLLSSLFGGNKSGESQDIRQEKKNFEILKYDGMRARNMGQLPYAVKCFEQAVALQAEPETMELLAGAYLQMNRTEDARLVLDKLVEAEPSVKSLLLLANVCYMQEDYERMEDVCRKIISLDEKNAVAYCLAAKAARGMKNDLQAIAMLTKAIMLKEDYVEAYLLRAEVLYGMYQMKDAMEDLDKILSYNPEEEDALLLKGKVEMAQDNKDMAFSCFDKVISLNPFHEKAYLLKGAVLLEQKEFDKAIEVYNEALELIPDNANLYQERGRARLLKGDKEGAMNDLKKAIELNPEAEALISGQFNNSGK